jgi:hypothetical protein
MESHSSSTGVSFLNILNIWFAMRKKEGKKTRKRLNLFIASLSVTKVISILLFVY